MLSEVSNANAVERISDSFASGDAHKRAVVSGAGTGFCRPRSAQLLAWMVPLAFAGCTSMTSPPPRPSTPAAHVSTNSGSTTTVASWYGPGFNGRRTSSGEVYNQHQLTAASRTLPLGSTVKVTNLDTGRSTVVRINDRGPYVRGRGIDLSRAAADQVGLTREGTARVRIARLDATASAAPEPPEEWSGNVHVHHHYRSHHYHHGSSHRIIHDPVGTWLLELIH